jgi:hypothetical protein
MWLDLVEVLSYGFFGIFSRTYRIVDIILKYKGSNIAVKNLDC